MRWRVEGVNLDTGEEVSIEVDAAGMVEAANWARQQRIALKPGSPEPVRDGPPPAAPEPELSYSERRRAERQQREEGNRPSAWARFASSADPMARSVAKGVFFGLWAWVVSVFLLGGILYGVSVAQREQMRGGTKTAAPAAQNPPMGWIPLAADARVSGVLLRGAFLERINGDQVTVQVELDNALDRWETLIRVQLVDRHGVHVGEPEVRVVNLWPGQSRHEVVVLAPKGMGQSVGGGGRASVSIFKRLDLP